MGEFESLSKNEFFIIESLNLNSVESKLYGFAICDGKIIQDNEVSDKTEFDGTGVYIYVKKTDNAIEILQDFNGSYGLYLFKKDDYFAISNSFIKLVEHIRENFVLTLNEDYAKAFLSVDVASCVFEETLVNEIIMIPKNYIINININPSSIHFEKIDYGDNSIPISSKKGIELLDQWFYKWVNIFRYIKNKTNNLAFDLSGGFDSRLILTIALNSFIDLNKVEIHSINDDKHTHKEDFEIASDISNYFNFKLNNNVLDSPRKYFDEIATPINISFYSKLGFHKQMYYRRYIDLSNVYIITGAGGGMLRGGYLDVTPDEFISRNVKRADKYSFDFAKATESIIKRSFSKLKKFYNLKDNSEVYLARILYKESRSRHHFGKGLAASYFTNSFKISPLLDPIIHKLNIIDEYCDDKDLLVSVIFTRYCPELINFKFDSGRYINEKTLEYARLINEKYPFKPVKYEFISEPEESDLSSLGELLKLKNNVPIKSSEIEKFIMDKFLSAKFKMIFSHYFSEEIYRKIYLNVRNSNYFPLEDVYSAIAVVKILNDIEYSKNKDFNSTFDWLNDFDDENTENLAFDYLLSDKLEKYNIARIDLKNIGSENNSIAINSISDINATYSTPNWFKNHEGRGVVIQGHNNFIEIEIECVLDGKLNIILRSVDSRYENQKIPIYINYKKLIIDDKIIFDESKIVYHDEPFVYELNVVNKQRLKILIEWEPI